MLWEIFKSKPRKRIVTPEKHDAQNLNLRKISHITIEPIRHNRLNYKAWFKHIQSYVIPRIAVTMQTKTQRTKHEWQRQPTILIPNSFKAWQPEWSKWRSSNFRCCKWKRLGTTLRYAPRCLGRNINMYYRRTRPSLTRQFRPFYMQDARQQFASVKCGS